MYVSYQSLADNTPAVWRYDGEKTKIIDMFSER